MKSLPKLTLTQMTERVINNSNNDQKFIYEGKSKAFGESLNQNKLLREPIFPKTSKN